MNPSPLMCSIVDHCAFNAVQCSTGLSPKPSISLIFFYRGCLRHRMDVAPVAF